MKNIHSIEYYLLISYIIKLMEQIEKISLLEHLIENCIFVIPHKNPSLRTIRKKACMRYN